VVEDHGDSVLKLRAAGTTVYEVSTRPTAVEQFDEASGDLDDEEAGLSDSELTEEPEPVESSDDRSDEDDATSDTDQSPRSEEVESVLTEVIDELAGEDGREGAARDAVYDLVAERTGASAAAVDEAFDDLRYGGYVYEVLDRRLKTT